MSTPMSTLARNGSHTSVSTTSSTSSMNSSSHHHHFFNHPHTLEGLKTWFEESFKHQDSRHDRIALGYTRPGIAVSTREMMEIKIQKAPHLRGMMDALPVPTRQMSMEVGWRPKLGTWPLSKHEAFVAQQLSR